VNAPAAAHKAMLVRAARESDMPAIHAIYAHHVLNGFGSFEERPPPLDELERRRAEVLARGLPYLVAELEGRIGGYCYAAPFRARSAYRYSLEDSIYVAPDLGRRGIGRALLTVLIERCTALHYRQMVAVIGDSENWPSIRLHEALGFAQVANLPSIGFKLGRWIDSIMMQRPLGPGDTILP
jgi:phosphinothricin acetyltransferase